MCLKQQRGYTLLEALIAANLLVLGFLMISRGLISRFEGQHELIRTRIAILSVHSALALKHIPPNDEKWERWRAQLQYYIPNAKISDNEGVNNICWEEKCLFQKDIPSSNLY